MSNNYKESLNKLSDDLQDIDYGYYHKHDSSFSSDMFRFGDKDFEYFMAIQEQFIEFGYNDLGLNVDVDLYVAKNFKKLKSNYLREKCLIAENFGKLKYYFQHPDLFNIKYEKLYAFEKFYNEVLSEDQRKKRSFITVVSHPETFEKFYQCTQEQVLEMFPMTDKKVSLLEQIHRAKLRDKKNKNK